MLSHPILGIFIEGSMLQRLSVGNVCGRFGTASKAIASKECESIKCETCNKQLTAYATALLEKFFLFSRVFSKRIVLILERDNLEVPKRGSIVSHETSKSYLERCKHNVYIDRLLVLLKE